MRPKAVNTGLPNEEALLAELRARTALWLPELAPIDQDTDPANALLGIAALFGAEITERLRRLPERQFRDFLDWLGFSPRAGQAARMPVAFLLSKGSRPVSADPPIAVQAVGNDGPQIFEITRPMLLQSAKLTRLVGADARYDSFSIAAPDFPTRAPPDTGPDTWMLVADITAGTTPVQLDPPEGLMVGGVLLTREGTRHRVMGLENGLVELAPPLGSTDQGGLVPRQPLNRLKAFDPFDPREPDMQRHALYLGDAEMLNATGPARLILGGTLPPADTEWHIWVEDAGDGIPDWKQLTMKTADTGDVFLELDQSTTAETEINGLSSRWLRAQPPEGKLLSERSNVSGLRARLAPLQEPGVLEAQDVNAIANTTPLVTDTTFLPFGQRPRLFDTFYIASAEAFSKPDASVTLDFILGDGFSGPLGFSRGQQGMIAGVTQDGRLRRVTVATPQTMQPLVRAEFEGRPVSFQPDLAPVPGAGLQVGSGNVFLVADETRIWRVAAQAEPTPEEWATPGGRITDMLSVPNGAFRRVWTVTDGTIARSNDGTTWVSVLVNETDPVRRLAPVWDTSGADPTEVDNVVLAIFESGRVATVTAAGTTADLGVSIDPAIRPMLFIGGPSETLFYVADDQSRQVRAANLTAGTEQAYDAPLVGTSLTPIRINGTGDWTAAWATDVKSATRVAIAVPGADWTIQGPATRGGRRLVQAPVQLIDGNLLFATSSGTAISATFDDDIGLQIEGVDLQTAATAAYATPPATDQFIGFSSRPLHAFPIDDVDDPGSGRLSVILDRRVRDLLSEETVMIYDVVEDGLSVTRNADALEAPSSPALAALIGTTNLTLLYMAGSVLRRAQISAIADIGLGVIQLTPSATNEIDLISEGETVANTRLVSTAETIDADVAETGILLTLPSRPATLYRRSNGAIVGTEVEPLPSGRVYLNAPPSGPNAEAAILAVWAFGPEVPVIHASPGNVDLSWEYWDGHSWALLSLTTDTNEDLLTTGKISFTVPEDLAASPVSGQEDYWIRSRIVGGDYGEETVTVDPTGTVTRDDSTIREPQIVSLSVTYEQTSPVLFTHVVTEDSGTFRDQTSANSAVGGRVRIFTPLSGEPGSRTSSQVDDTPCTCSSAQDDDATDTAETSSPEHGPALYLGFDAPLNGGPISIFFQAEDTSALRVPVLAAEAWTGERFEAVRLRDGTRGLSESGIIEMDLATPTDELRLFGATQHWIRLRPARLGAGELWAPKLAGVFVNAGWADAAETRRNELLGSSDGSPGQTTALASSPILNGSLVLAVREALGGEETERLAQRPGALLPSEAVGGREGHWVRWTEASLFEAGPKDRVFALDAASGLVTFGDGVRGRIPPAGRDCVLAVSYRTGGGSDANAVEAWSQVSLVTPLDSVEAAVLPQPARGGTDAESPEDVMATAPGLLASRNAALTVTDYAAMAVASSAEVAQARAVSKAGQLDVIVAMGRISPLPTNADVRVIEERLRAASIPSLSTARSLRVRGPRLTEIGLRVVLSIEDIARSAQIREATAARISALLHPGTGGIAGTGWPFGQTPDESDLAAALSEVPGLLWIDEVVVDTPQMADDMLTVLDPDRIDIDVSAVDAEVLQ